jgi:hypothetical protein
VSNPTLRIAADLYFPRRAGGTVKLRFIYLHL